MTRWHRVKDPAARKRGEGKKTSIPKPPKTAARVAPPMTKKQRAVKRTKQLMVFGVFAAGSMMIPLGVGGVLAPFIAAPLIVAAGSTRTGEEMLQGSWEFLKSSPNRLKRLISRRRAERREAKEKSWLEDKPEKMSLFSMGHGRDFCRAQIEIKKRQIKVAKRQGMISEAAVLEQDHTLLKARYELLTEAEDQRRRHHWTNALRIASGKDPLPLGGSNSKGSKRSTGSGGSSSSSSANSKQEDDPFLDKLGGFFQSPWDTFLDFIVDVSSSNSLGIFD